MVKKLVLAIIAILFMVSSSYALTFVWDANTEPELVGYKFYIGTAPRVYFNPFDLGNVTTYSRTDFLTDGTVYYFAVTAYDKYGIESDYSNEVVWSLDLTPPVITSANMTRTIGSPIANITATATDKKGVTGWIITTTSTKPLANDSRWTATLPATYTFSKTNNTIYIWAKDAAGNISESAKLMIIIPAAPKNLVIQ